MLDPGGRAYDGCCLEAAWIVFAISDVGWAHECWLYSGKFGQPSTLRGDRSLALAIHDRIPVKT